MIDFDATQRFIRLRERVRVAAYHELRKDGHHKSSEGAASIAFCLPPVVSDDETPYWCVEVYSYVLGPQRSHSFFGKTASEAISKAEDAVEQWCFPAEMEMFEQRIGYDPEEDHDRLGDPDAPDASDAPEPIPFDDPA